MIRQALGIPFRLVRGCVRLLQGCLRGLLLVAVVACSACVFASVALWDWTWGAPEA